MCNFAQFVKSVKVFSMVLMVLTSPKSGNFTLSCPLKKGLYVMKDIYIPEDAPVLRFMYSPNSVYTIKAVHFGFLENGKKIQMQDINITMTIVKKC